VDINKVLAYVTLSLIVIIGILIVSGMVGGFDLKWRLIIGAVIVVYTLMRVWILSRKPKQKSLLRHLDADD